MQKMPIPLRRDFQSLEMHGEGLSRQALNSTNDTNAMLEVLTNEIQRKLELTCVVTSVSNLTDREYEGVKLLIAYPNSNTKLVQEALQQLVAEPTSVTVNGVTFPCTFHVVPTIPVFPNYSMPNQQEQEQNERAAIATMAEKMALNKELEEIAGEVWEEMTEDEIFDLLY